MKGRLEHSLAIEAKTKELLSKCDSYFQDYYYSMVSTKEPTTIMRYILIASNFVAFTKEKNPAFQISDLKRVDIDVYMNSLIYTEKDGEIKTTSDSYRATVWSALNCFVKFLAATEVIERNIMETIDRPKVKDEVERVFMDVDEIKEVLRNIQNRYYVNSICKNYEGWEARDAVIISLLVETGMRVTALTEINEEDFDFENKIVKVTDKRRKVHEYPISDKTAEIALDWNKSRKRLLKEAKKKDDGAFFLSSRRERMSQRGINKLIARCTESTGKKISAHKFRGSYATNLYQATGDIYLVKECMGHDSVNTTQIYIKPNDNSRGKALNIMEELLKN